MVSKVSSLVVTVREVLLQYRRFLAPIVSTLNWFLHQYLNFAPSSHYVLGLVELHLKSWVMILVFFSLIFRTVLIKQFTEYHFLIWHFYCFNSITWIHTCSTLVNWSLKITSNEETWSDLSFASLFFTPFVVIKFRTLKQLRDLLSLIEIAFVCYSHIWIKDIWLIQHLFKTCVWGIKTATESLLDKYQLVLIKDSHLA